MDLRQLIRIWFKVSLWFVLASLILFWNVRPVNFAVQPKYDFVPVKKVGKKSLSNKRVVKFTTKSQQARKINPIQKRQFLLRLVLGALKNKHFSALDLNTYSKLCNYYSNWCNIIEIDDFDYQNKVYYTALTIYLLEFVDKYLPALKENLDYIKIQPEKNWRRGYAGHHSIIMNVKKNMSYKQFFEVLTHEMGHVVDLWVLNGDSWFKSKKFTEFWKVVFAKNDPSLEFYKLCWQSEKIKKPDVYISDFVSWYGMTDPFEDFAETFNMYLNHNWVFQQMSSESNILRQKYNFMAKLFNWNYIRADKNFDYKIGFRPWDSTTFISE